jgi:predicted N-acetyltransferase YhbS
MNAVAEGSLQPPFIFHVAFALPLHRVMEADEEWDMIAIRQERATDQAARETLLDRAYGAGRFRKPSQKIRAGRLPALGLSFVATHRGRMIGTVRLWNISAGETPALLLGPLAVLADFRSQGIGAALMGQAVARARELGHKAILLVGDAAYYGRFGFSAAATGDLRMPGPFDQARLLGLELAPGALDHARGLIIGTGARIPATDPSTPAGKRPRAA